MEGTAVTIESGSDLSPTLAVVTSACGSVASGPTQTQLPAAAALMLKMMKDVIFRRLVRFITQRSTSSN
jgi:hypothetical protein